MEEGRDEIVDALNVAARRMADRPDVEDALERALGGVVGPKRDTRIGAGHVDVDLVPDRLVEAGLTFEESRADGISVLLPLAGENGDAAG